MSAAHVVLSLRADSSWTNSCLPAAIQMQERTCHSRMLVSQLTRRAMTCWSSRVSWLLLPLALATCKRVRPSACAVSAVARWPKGCCDEVAHSRVPVASI